MGNPWEPITWETCDAIFPELSSCGAWPISSRNKCRWRELRGFQSSHSAETLLQVTGSILQAKAAAVGETMPCGAYTRVIQMREKRHDDIKWCPDWLAAELEAILWFSKVFLSLFSVTMGGAPWAMAPGQDAGKAVCISGWLLIRDPSSLWC